MAAGTVTAKETIPLAVMPQYAAGKRQNGTFPCRFDGLTGDMAV
jgi:hypothetical protein